MSIKDLARELYRARQQVEKLEKLLAGATPDQEMRLAAALEEAKAEWRLLRNMIDGRKSEPCSRRK
ncbi:hypothetical protein ACUUL3_16445 [Thiovibrio sp. JS02]